MSITATIEEIMETEANFGLFHCYSKIGMKKAVALREKGFEVTDSKEVNYFPRIHKISWKESIVVSDDVTSLDENSEEFTFPQKLWIISSKEKAASKVI